MDNLNIPVIIPGQMSSNELLLMVARSGSEPGKSVFRAHQELVSGLAMKVAFEKLSGESLNAYHTLIKLLPWVPILHVRKYEENLPSLFSGGDYICNLDKQTLSGQGLDEKVFTERLIFIQSEALQIYVPKTFRDTFPYNLSHAMFGNVKEKVEFLGRQRSS